MNLTTKGRYAVTAMLDLSLNAKDQPACLSDISERQNISLSYLEQLFSKLRKQGLVTSIRGPGGGYKLNHEPRDISLSKIVTAVDENLDFSNCGGKKGCHTKSKRCLTHDLWMGLSERIESFLDGITLQEMIDKKDIRHIPLDTLHKRN